MSAFVTGGTGFIGKRLVGKLLARGHEAVHVLVRKPTPELIAGLAAIAWTSSGNYKVRPDGQGAVLRFGKWVETTDWPPRRSPTPITKG